MRAAVTGGSIARPRHSPNGQSTDSRLARFWWIVLIAGTALAAAAAYGILSRKNLNPDAFVFGIAANRLLAGQRLYVDFFEAKPPLATLFYAIPGALWPRSYLAICWLLPGLLMLQGAFWLWQFRPRLLTAAACLWFITLYPATFTDFGWTSTEHISNVFITVVLVLSVAMFRDGRITAWRCLLAGASVCAAFHVRQNAVICVLVPMAVVLTTRETPRVKLQALLWLGIGGIIAWTAILGLVWILSDPKDYFYQVFAFPKRFAQSGGMGDRYYLLAAMGPHSLPPMFGLAAALALLGPYRRLALVIATIGLVSCLISPRPHFHYWANLFPFLAACLLLGLPRKDPKTPLLERVALAVVGTCVFTGMLNLYSVAMSPSDIQPMGEVAAWIDADAGPSDTLYVFSPLGTEYVQFRSRLLPANKYTVGWEIDWNNGMMAESFEEIRDSYLRRPPTYFVVHEHELAAMNKAVSQEPGEVRLATRLALDLMDAHPYDHVKELNGFHIHVLREGADRSATPPERVRVHSGRRPRR